MDAVTIAEGATASAIGALALWKSSGHVLRIWLRVRRTWGLSRLVQDFEDQAHELVRVRVEAAWREHLLAEQMERLPAEFLPELHRVLVLGRSIENRIKTLVVEHGLVGEVPQPQAEEAKSAQPAGGVEWIDGKQRLRRITVPR